MRVVSEAGRRRPVAPALEAAFRRRRLFEQIRQERVGLWIGFVFTSGAALLRANGVGVFAEDAATIAIRFLLASVFLSLLAVAKWWPRFYFKRHSIALGAALIVVSTSYLLIRFWALIDGSQALAAPALSVAVAQMLLLTFAGLSIPWLVAVTLPLDVAIIGSFLVVEGSEAILVSFLLGVATVGGVLARVELDSRSRQVFFQQRALRDAQAQLGARQRMLLEAIDKKERLMSFIAHDMRQPLLSLAIHREALSKAVGDGNPGRMSSSVEAIGECIRFMQLNTDRLLETPDAEGGGRRSVAPVDVSALLESVVSISAARASMTGVRLHLRISDRGGSRIGLSQEAMLAEVLSNLIDNGIKYHADPLSRSTCWVLVGIVRSPSVLRIDVVDNGLGISPRGLEKIFDFGWRDGQVIATGQVTGQGLGLASVAAALRTLPGHRISVCSRVGVGSRFSVHLPRA